MEPEESLKPQPRPGPIPSGYYAQHLLSLDEDFIGRVSACAARENIGRLLPSDWAGQNVQWIAAAPGFADAYAYALATGVPKPGADPAVITDADLLAAVQQRI